MATYALHGFLGTPSDWDEIFPPSSKMLAPNLFEKSTLSFRNWAKSFNHEILGAENVLVGYSMGGRLALHALIDNPSLWKSAIIISASTGIEQEKSRSERFAADKELSAKFLTASWDKLIQEWNRQPLFDNFTIARQEKDFQRKTLAEALVNWSLGNQDFLKNEIENLDIPILWVVGENDHKYVSMAKQIKFKNSMSKISIAPQAGHRVPWQQKLWFQQEVKKFL